MRAKILLAAALLAGLAATAAEARGGRLRFGAAPAPRIVAAPPAAARPTGRLVVVPLVAAAPALRPALAGAAPAEDPAPRAAAPAPARPAVTRVAGPWCPSGRTAGQGVGFCEIN
jgi:hypothetical protein